ncbi:MAG: PAS domain S-box protein [Gammaproteobacteria bacterium]|nr:PAS domain S-box protein [Gammaproteobacteria bacterium]MBT8436701.1 PAS domain S-box protein [Gammaproteobacteria bacterium]
MIQRQPFNQLFLIMATATLLVSAVSIISLYNTAIRQHRLSLIETVQSRARLIESTAQFDLRQFDRDISGDERLVFLEKISSIQREQTHFGKTGEFVLARREGDRVIFLQKLRHAQPETLESIPLNGNLGEPMRRALAGESGVQTALDYRGEKVLAAFEPLPTLGLGLVAKIDNAEIRAPFVRAGVLAAAIAVFIIFIASRFFLRISRPLEETIDQQAETFQILAQTSPEAIILAGTDGVIQFVNPATERLFGYRKKELVGAKLNLLMPREHSVAHDDYIQKYLQTGMPTIIGLGRQLTAVRKDGSRFPIYLSIGDIKTSHTRLFAGVIMDISEQQQLQKEILEIPVQEQRRIGQELHDGLGQQLTGLGLLATSLLNKASKPEHELASKLAKGLQDSISQVRALSRGLMPVDIDTAGFINSLETLIEEIRLQTNLDIQLTILEQVRIADNTTAMHLYRIVQEALNNAIKHAEAKQISVGVGVEGARGCFLISDNGKGLQNPRRESSGLGLRIMKHRCGLIDAELVIESAPGDGTRIKCYFPIENNDNLDQ